MALTTSLEEALVDTDLTAATGESVEVRGHRIPIPVEVRSAKMIQASWLVSASAAQGMIDYSGLRVRRMAGTLATVSLAAVQYTDTDLGPYNEIAVAVVVEPHDGSGGGSLAGGSVTTFIHRLPVNQKLTCAAGRDIWGFPKWVSDITFSDGPRRTDVVMQEKNDLVLGLSVSRGFLPLPDQELEMSCYSYREGVLRRTPWTNRNTDVTMGIGGGRLELGTRHPMATQLRSLGLPKRPIMTMRVGSLGATFGRAEEI